MTANPKVADLVQRNRNYASAHKPLPTMLEVSTVGKQRPKVLIITCLDPRCVPEHFLQIEPLEALVLRNPCGHVKSAVADLLAVDHLMGGLDEVMIIHHTDCGAFKYTEEGVKGGLKKRLPANLHGEIDKLDIHGITDLEQSVRDDLSDLKTHPLIPDHLKENAYGFTFDIKTGLLASVE